MGVKTDVLFPPSLVALPPHVVVRSLWGALAQHIPELDDDVTFATRDKQGWREVVESSPINSGPALCFIGSQESCLVRGYRNI